MSEDFEFVDNKTVLDILNVTKRFGKVVAVDSVDLTVKQGEFITLLGPSGSGKTTLLRLIAGFEDLSDGSIDLNGRDISFLTPAQREIGMVFQHYMLFPHMTVGDNIAYGLKMRGWDPSDREQRIQEMLEAVRMSGYEDRLPRQLSGGQQQRVALARCLAFDPHLLLMDEPLGALDRALRIDLQKEIRRIHRELGTTVIYVTHDQQEALALSDRIAIMHKGKILALDTPSRLYERPPSRFVATFFSAANLLPVQIVEETREGIARVNYRGQEKSVNTSRSFDGEEGFLAVRPEAFTGRRSADSLRVTIQVDDGIYLGDYMQVSGITDEGTSIVALLVPSDASGAEPGSELDLFAPPSEAFLISKGPS
jgi:putative spermidine/putrescine transport system ATP-binding protein